VSGAQAQSPTPVTSILNGGSSTTLEVTYSGGLLAPGRFADISNYSAPGDSIPATGAGTRMMWYPEKAAFRVGGIDGAQWDATNVGVYSVAFGADTKASVGGATAMGTGTTASGASATAMGFETTAGGDVTTAMGVATIASNISSLSMGECNSANTTSDNSLLAAGNGKYDTRSDACDSRSDALVLDKSGNLTISGNLTENSDRRLKTAIRALGSGTLKKLSKLRPVRYQFKDQNTHPSGEQIGLIAQDVRKEFPQLVRKGSNGMLALAYPKMTAVLLKGIQEQQGELREKQVQIDSLKGRVRRLENQQREIDRLKARLAALETGRSPSAIAGLTGTSDSLLLAFLLGGLFGAGLLWRRQG
jgi:hypothetical protein